jgi:hypothetical protein
MNGLKSKELTNNGKPLMLSRIIIKDIKMFRVIPS